MIYDVTTGQRTDATVQRGPVVVDALHAYGDISYVVVSAVGYAEDEQSVAEAKRLFELYKAAPEMLEALERILPAAIAREEPDNYDQFGDIAFALAAIAKAKGEKP